MSCRYLDQQKTANSSSLWERGASNFPSGPVIPFSRYILVFMKRANRNNNHPTQLWWWLLNFNQTNFLNALKIRFDRYATGNHDWYKSEQQNVWYALSSWKKRSVQVFDLIFSIVQLLYKIWFWNFISKTFTFVVWHYDI